MLASICSSRVANGFEFAAIDGGRCGGEQASAPAHHDKKIIKSRRRRIFQEFDVRKFGAKTAHILRALGGGAAIVLLGGAVAFAINAPGHLSYDSVVQLLEARQGDYGNWHPPVMSWLLGLSDALVPGTTLFLAFNMALAYGALASICAGFARSWAAPFAAAICVVLPQLFVMQGAVWKDVLFANACVAGYVCMLHAASQWRRTRLRLVLLSAAAALLTLAALTRQNGVLALFPAGAAVAVLFWLHSDRARLRRAAFAAAVFTGSCGLMAWGGKALLDLRTTGEPGATVMMERLQIHDIMGAAARDPGFHPAILEQEAPAIAHFIQREAARYTPISVDAVEDWQESSEGVSNPKAVSRQWRDLIVNRPLTYLAVRTTVFHWLFSPPDPKQVYTYHTGVGAGPEGELEALGMSLRLDGRDRFLRWYADWFTNAGLMHPVFAAIGAACFVFLCLRRRPEDYVMLALILSAALFALSFFVISISSDYRYLYLIDMAALASGLYLACDPSLRTGAPPFADQ
jgi:4-amino-4-deoxy-L-arabinose transferase-like glycosyltransferase